MNKIVALKPLLVVLSKKHMLMMWRRLDVLMHHAKMPLACL